MRTRHRRLAVALSLSVLFLGAARPALGLANRVFVSARSGNNANSCDNILTPCQTFAGAVLQLNPGGEAIVLDSGGYGPVTITKSLIIEAPPGVTAFIHPPSGDAVTVSAGGSDTVVLRGLVLNGGSGNAITVNTVGVLHVESCVISGFGSSGILFNSAGQLFVKDTIVRGNGYIGIDVLPASGAAKASVDHCRLEGNSFGLVSDATAGTAQATIRDSVTSGNSGSGLAVKGGGELNAEGCLVANNNTGLDSMSGTIRASNCTVTDNVIGLSSSFSSLLSRSNNTVEGNGTNGSFTGTYLAK